MNEKKRIEELTKEWIKKLEPEFNKNLDLARSNPAYLDLVKQFENRYYFFTGLALGVLFGILGNFLSTHWIELLRLVVPSQQNWLVANLIFFFVFLSAIIFCISWIRERLRSDKKTIDEIWLGIMREALLRAKAPMPEELIQLLKKDAQKTEKDALKKNTKTRESEE